MTHEELLEKINDQEYAYDTLGNALYAVVELHKPTTHKDYTDIWCDTCEFNYPCPTIQAIEKELL
jgi:hypothetical protein